ncbi:MAG: type II toxin-antitoxin system Phd/YefM family antitoxin [Chlorobiaceae bacterium]|nr:type II toxin-antitoxin system Phd/YefM family antitoxin [Chlorobiaceae bacterium]
MIEITSTELRKNIGKYLDIAMQKKEQVLVRHRNKGVFMLTPKQTNGHRPKRTDTSDNSFEQQELQQIIKEAEGDFSEGRHTVIKNPANIWESIQ